MEQKCLKTNVYVNDTLFSDSIEQAIDIDFTLPDYCPDISKIFKCHSVPRISNKSINGKNITIEGNVTLTLLYCDKDGNLSSYEYLYPFSKSFEIQAENAGANICCKIKNEYINCRAVTGRKVDIHGAVGIYIKVFKRSQKEIISDYDDKNIELRREITPATVPVGYCEKYLMIEEEIAIGQGQPQIKNILRCDAVSSVKETKLINDKAVVKGEISVCILYCGENTPNPQSVKTVIPYSQIIDIDGVSDTCECDTKSEIAFFEVKPRISVSGEAKSFSLVSKILLSCEAFCKNEIPIILDAFSKKYQAEIIKNKVPLEKITENISEIYHCKKNITLDEEISSVIDVRCSIQGTTTKFEGLNMIISGTVIVGMILCTINDNAIYTEKPIEFEYKYPVKTETAHLHCEPQIEILSCGYTITGSENIEMHIELEINAAIYEKQVLSLISDLKVDETAQIKHKNKGSMTIYFPSNNECVWDIARIYNASVEEIMLINELDSEKLKAGKMILVPVG